MAEPKGSVRRCWLLDVMGSRFLAVRARDLQVDEVPLSPSAASKVVERAMDHPKDIGQLSSLQQALADSGLRSTSAINRSLLLRAFSAGDLLLLRRNVQAPTARTEMQETIAEQVKFAKEVKTWVEMEVVDMEGNPVPNKKYLCVLPDGSMRDGLLDKAGRVRFDGIDPGNCVFTLTELDRDAWDRVQ